MVRQNTCRIPWYVTMARSNTNTARQQATTTGQVRQKQQRTLQQGLGFRGSVLFLVAKKSGVQQINVVHFITVTNTAVTTQTQQGTTFQALKKKHGAKNTCGIP